MGRAESGGFLGVGMCRSSSMNFLAAVIKALAPGSTRLYCASRFRHLLSGKHNPMDPSPATASAFFSLRRVLSRPSSLLP